MMMMSSAKCEHMDHLCYYEKRLDSQYIDHDSKLLASLMLSFCTFVSFLAGLGQKSSVHVGVPKLVLSVSEK